MPDARHADDPGLVLDLVDDSVVPGPDPIGIDAAQPLRSLGTWVLAEGSEAPCDTIEQLL